MKNKWLAAILNIWPGIGYLYLGVRTPFAVILLLMLPVTIIAGVTDPAISNSPDTGSGFSWGILAIFATPMIAFMVDAFNEAKRVNRPKSAVVKQLTANQVEAKADADLELFVVGVPKFVILSMLTGSIYTVYWAYQNWKAVQSHLKTSIRPFWRALFGVFFIYSLLGHMQAILRERDSKVDLSPLDRSVMWIGLALLSAVWKPLLLLDLLRPFTLMGVQKKVNAVYASDKNPSSRLSGPEWTVVVAGLALTLLAYVGTFFPAN